MKRAMTRTSVLLLLIAVGAMVTGCLGSGDDSGSNVGSVTDVTGTWEGFVSGGEALTFELTQDLAAFSGTASVDGVEASMSGTVDGKNVTGTIATAPLRILRGSVSFDTMTGTFRDDTGNIVSDFSMVRTQTVEPL